MDEIENEKNLSSAKKRFGAMSLASAIALSGTAITLYHIYGTQLVPFVAVVGIVSWLYLLSKFTPRCPKCGQGIYSVLEIGRVPIITRWPHGKNCLGCGKNLNE